MSITRLLPLALAALVAGCGGEEEPRSEEDRAGDVAKRYVSANANSEEADCAKTLAAGVDRDLCDDLGPLASRVDPDVESVELRGELGTVTVTGAGTNTLLDISLARQGGEWRVRSWRGREK